MQNIQNKKHIKEVPKMPAAIDLTGNKYGELTVIEMLRNYNNTHRTYCRCVNDNKEEIVVRADALRSGATKTAKGSQNKGRFKDLTDKIFGRLLVKELTNKRGSNGAAIWRCGCLCGNECEALSSDLIRGRTVSCGCVVQEYYDSISYNLTNQKFGQLTAIEYIGRKGSSGNYKRLWRCKCDCGGETCATVSDLVSGCTVSCGCISVSKGELLVSQILEKHNINYIDEHTFDDCRNILPLPFDFYLPDYNVCIEYQGRQHYEPIDYFGGNDTFEQVKMRDDIKKAYCENNNILLLCIPYTYTKEEIEDMILNILSPVTITA